MKANLPFKIYMTFILAGSFVTHVTIPNSVKSLLVLYQLLPDKSQQSRCEDLISEPANGILKIIRDSQSSDSQKSYQLIKLLITASNRSEDVSRYLMR